VFLSVAGDRSGRVAKDGCDRWATAYSGQLGCRLETVCGSVRGKKSTRSVTCDARRTNGGTADARRCLSSAPAYRGGCAQFINRWASCLQRELPGSPPLGAGRCDRPVDWRRPISSVAPTHDALFQVVAFLMYYIRFCPNEWFRSRRRDSSCAVQHALFRATVAAW
jgi:hypothetical protein